MTRLPRLFLIVAALGLSASACSRSPARPVASHPPAADLSCPAEPDVPTDPTEASADAFDDAVLITGRACRDALVRVCQWHLARGMGDAPCVRWPGG